MHDFQIMRSESFMNFQIYFTGKTDSQERFQPMKAALLPLECTHVIIHGCHVFSINFSDLVSHVTCRVTCHVTVLGAALLQQKGLTVLEFERAVAIPPGFRTWNAH